MAKNSISTETIKESLRTWGLGIFVGLFVVISLPLVVIPQASTAIDIASRIRDDQQKLSAVTQKLATLRSTSEAELNSQVNLIEQALPSQKPVFTILTSLQSQAQRTGVNLVGFDFSPGSVATESSQEDSRLNDVGKPGSLAEMPLEITVEGAFNQINNYLEILDGTAPLMEISNLSIESSSGQETGLLQASIELIVFYSLPPMTIGKASAPLPEITPKNQETFIGIGQLQSFGSESQAPVPANQGKSNLFSF